MEFSTLETLKYIFSMNGKWVMFGLDMDKLQVVECQ